MNYKTPRNLGGERTNFLFNAELNLCASRGTPKAPKGKETLSSESSTCFVCSLGREGREGALNSQEDEVREKARQAAGWRTLHKDGMKERGRW